MFATAQTSKVAVRWLIARDVPEVLAIEDAASEHPWQESDFRHYLANRNCISVVAELGDKVLAYMVYQLHTDHLTLLNFAVHPDYRRQGVGTRLLDKLKSKLSSHRRVAIELECRESNIAACLFFRACGFVAEAVRRDAFEAPDEDGIFFMYLEHECQGS